MKIENQIPERELLLRCLDGRASADELTRVQEWLRADPEARAFLREVAEQAVMVAELERSALGRQIEIRPRGVVTGEKDRRVIPVNFRAWQWRAAAAALVALLAVIAVQFFRTSNPGIVHVSKVTGSIQYFGAKGRLENQLRPGTTLRAGDSLETRSCDAWIELKLRDGSTITVAGNSALRILDAEGGTKRFKLSRGSLWGSPGIGAPSETVSIQTPTVLTETRGAQFDIQASASETMVRVNEGSARVRENLQGNDVNLLRGQQVAASLGRTEALKASPQAAPIDNWVCDLGKVPDVILGKWLPARGFEQARLGADPLLWPVSETRSVMLYAVAVAAWMSAEKPVQLHADSRFRFRGRTERAQMVRFGFSAQKMRGAFAGKFEIDVQPDRLGAVGETWEVDIPLKNFRPLYPQLALSVEGLELTDVYALTIRDDAGLEINHIELEPRR